MFVIKKEKKRQRQNKCLTLHAEKCVKVPTTTLEKLLFGIGRQVIQMARNFLAQQNWCPTNFVRCLGEDRLRSLEILPEINCLVEFESLRFKHSRSLDFSKCWSRRIAKSDELQTLYYYFVPFAYSGDIKKRRFMCGVVDYDKLYAVGIKRFTPRVVAAIFAGDDNNNNILSINNLPHMSSPHSNTM